MGWYTVAIAESRDLVFHVEADSEDEATQLAEDMEAGEAVRDSFRERTHEWTMRGRT
jgi:hypothetical protein